MFDRSHAPSDSELEQLLLDAGRQLAYPPMPDFAAAFEARATAALREPLGAESGPWRPPRHPPVSDPSPSIPASRPRTRWTQALRLGGALAAFALVGLTLVLIFRNIGDGEQPNGGATTYPTEPLLIAVGSEGTITALDPLSGEVRYTINGDNQPDAIFSPDGTRLFVAGLSLSAHDSRTGDEIWRVPYQFRVGTISNVGPSTLAISPDGTRLYIYSYDMGRSTGPTADSVPFFIQTFDTASGELLGESEPYASGAICAARLHPSPDGTKLYAPCERGTGYRVYELPSGALATAQPVTGFPRLIATASHGDRLFLVTHSGEFTTQQENLTIIDMREGTIFDQRLLNLDGYAVQGQAVVSPDGSRLYVGVSDTVDDFGAGAVLAFDTQTWEQVGRLEPEIPVTSQELAADADGTVYAASTVYGDTSLATSASTVWRMDPETETIEAVAEFPEQEIAHVLTAQVPAAPEPEPAPTTTGQMTEPLLIAVSSEGPVTAIEPETGATRYSINGGYQPDAIFSPDGTRVYVAGDELSAHDAATGQELWRVAYQYRLHWTIDTTAPSTLAISPDGSRLYIASYAQERATSPDANTIPHFIQTFDTATGANLGESEAVRGGCTVPIHPAPDGQQLHAPCDGDYFVYELPAGTLQPPPDGRAIVSASAQLTDELYLVTSAGYVQVVDMSAVTIIRDAALEIDGQVLPQLAALSADGAHLYLGISTGGERFAADQVLMFDTATWQQVAQFSLEKPLTNRDLAVGIQGAVYGASTTFVDETSMSIASTLWRMDPDTGTVEAVTILPTQEVAHVLLGYVPAPEPDKVAPTPTSDATATATLPVPSHVPGTDMFAVGTALAEVPEDVRTCTALQTGPVGRPVIGRVLAGSGDFTITRIVDDLPAPRVPYLAGDPAVVRIYAGPAPYPETAQATIRATHVGSNEAIQTDTDNVPRLIRVPDFDEQLWEVELTFPRAGCWELLFITDQFVGVAWLDVFETLPPTATPGPTPTPPLAQPPTQPISTMRPGPTATGDASPAAIQAALDALPPESKGCQATPGGAGDAFGWEVRGVTLIGGDELWMSFVGNGADYLLPPLQAGRSTTVYWNIGGPNPDNPAFVELTATELGAGTQISPDGPQNAGESPFFDGVMWKTSFTFPHAGCWQVVAERDGYAGVLWLTVEDAP